MKVGRNSLPTIRISTSRPHIKQAAKRLLHKIRRKSIGICRIAATVCNNLKRIVEPRQPRLRFPANCLVLAPVALRYVQKWQPQKGFAPSCYRCSPAKTMAGRSWAHALFVESSLCPHIVECNTRFWHICPLLFVFILLIILHLFHKCLRTMWAFRVVDVVSFSQLCF